MMDVIKRLNEIIQYDRDLIEIIDSELAKDISQDYREKLSKDKYNLLKKIGEIRAEIDTIK